MTNVEPRSGLYPREEASAEEDGATDMANVEPRPRYIVPMIDARRMEVYTAVFENGVQTTQTAPAIIDENSFADLLEQGPCLFIGDGAGKCADVIKHPNARFCQCWPKASAMLAPAMKAYKEKRFEDVAYFEPFYLKEFVATVSKKKLF